MDDSDGDQPSDTMRGRVDENRWKLWVLMNADRRLIAGLILGAFFAVLVALSLVDLSPMRTIVEQKNGLWWLFSPMIGAIITGVTLVATINQLVLSQELGPLGDQRERMQGAIEFREDVESWLDIDASPPDPGSFLEALIDGVQTYANRLDDAIEESRDEELRERIDDYVDSLTDHAQEVGDGLSEAQFGTFAVVFSALNFNYSWKIYEAKRLRTRHAGDMAEETADALDDVIQVLEFFGPAREHFKTLYFQWELVNLSRVMLYASVPSLLVTAGMMLYVDASAIAGQTVGIDNLVLVVSGATTVTLLPFVLLLSYIFRIATVAKRTLAIGPFILRDTDRTDDIDWDG